MANLTHLFKIGENVKYVVNDFDEKRIYDGTVKESRDLRINWKMT